MDGVIFHAHVLGEAIERGIFLLMHRISYAAYDDSDAVCVVRFLLIKERDWQ
ncbi:hypothetical protein Bca101_083173 [Brassica carinata]